MGSAIKSDFKENLLALIKGSWANRVAKVCSHWCGQDGIEVVIPENPTGSNPCRVLPNMNILAKNIYNRMVYEGMLVETSDDVNTAKIDSDESYFPDDDAPASGYEKLDSTSKWDKGDTDGAASDPKEVGVKFDVITRCAYDADNGIHYFYARTLTFSKSGLLISVGAENAATQVGA